MKTTFIILSLFILTVNASVAQQPKSKKTEKAPTASEMEAMMREAQKEIDNLDPEAKRAMDSMGITIPSFKNMPQVSDAQLQKAMEDENRLVPVKDVNRIAAISKTPLSNSTLPGYVSAAHNKVITRLKPSSKTKGEEIYKMIKLQYNSPVATGNVAASLFLMGKVELALYVMGKACMDGPTNTDNLNNYASMLSMGGAEQVSVPLFMYINKRYPRNSTVLNNLGQAWFGLGDIDKANLYLDSTIRLAAAHPQANYTKSFIEESKGNKSAAIDYAKRSIKKAYTQKKQDRLKKLGYQLEGKDLSWDKPMPQDPLALEKFKWPAYPNNVSESELLEKEWDVFRASCQEKIYALQSEQGKLELDVTASNQKRTQQLLAAGKKGLLVDPFPRSAAKAFIKLKYLVDGTDGHLAYAYEQKTQRMTRAYLAVGEFEDKLRLRLNELEEKYEDKFGEGKPNPFDDACKDENTAKDAFLSSANQSLENASADYLKFLRSKINDQTYYEQYTMWPEDFELAKVRAKIHWLTAMRSQKVMFQNKSSWCHAKTEGKEKPFKLAAFDDVACKYHSEYKSPVGSIKVDCGRMVTTLDVKFLKLGLKQDMDKETFGDQFMSCSVEVGIGASAGIPAGPLKAEASVGAALAAEFDRNGLTDIIIKSSAGVNAGTDIISDGSMAGVGVSDLSVEVGVQGQVSLISGKSSIESTGLLQGAFSK